MPKLLLADDSVTIQRVIELTFADEDIQVIAVGDGQQAIARIDADRPDVVLADIGMPERDGYEVAAHVKGNPQTSHIPVLLLTGAFEPIDEARARAVGCDGVLVKPFEPQMVINRVKDLLAGRRPASLWSSPGSAAAQPVSAPAHAASGRPEAAAAAAGAPPAGSEGEPRKESLDDYFDRLDAAFSSDAAPAPALDPAIAPSQPSAPPDTGAEFGSWDIPFESRSGARPAPAPPPAESAPAPASAGATSPVAPFPTPPAAPRPAPTAQAPPASDIPALAPEMSPAAQAPALADAFAALLAAEQKLGPAASAPAAGGRLDESTIDEIVRRVIARMTDEVVRASVLDVAERLVREEIDRIKKQARL